MICLFKELTNLKNNIENAFQVNLDLLNRDRDLVEARIIFCLVALSSNSITLVELGTFLEKDHSTIVYYKKQAQILIQYNKKFKEKLKNYLVNIGKSEEEINLFFELNFLKKKQKRV